MASKPLAKLKKSLTDDCRKVRFLGDDEETRLRAALDAREERRCAERDSANYWRRERGYVLLPSLRPLAFTDQLKPLVLLSINTGARRGELCDLDWSTVDLERRVMTVDRKSVVWGRRVEVRGDLGGRRTCKKQRKK